RRSRGIAGVWTNDPAAASAGTRGRTFAADDRAPGTTSGGAKRGRSSACDCADGPAAAAAFADSVDHGPRRDGDAPGGDRWSDAAVTAACAALCSDGTTGGRCNCAGAA